MPHVDPVDILLVDDSAADRELTMRALKKSVEVARVFAVKDGAEALEFLFSTGPHANGGHQAPPRLVLLDLKLPKVDGLEVLRQIKSNQETNLIPVVIFSSSQEDRDIAESYKLGANSYMVKPVDFDKFVECVSEVGYYWLRCNRLPQ